MFIPDPGSRILIFTHPGSWFPDLGSRIPDPKTATKERGEKKLVVIPFYVATNFIETPWGLESDFWVHQKVLDTVKAVLWNRDRRNRNVLM
jgi:hypothetical protein